MDTTTIDPAATKEDAAIGRAEIAVLNAWTETQVDPYQFIDGVATLAHAQDWGDDIVNALEKLAGRMRAQLVADEQYP